MADGHAEMRYKHELPNYGVFDEKRVFVPGPLPEPVDFRGVRLGLPICEDVWFPDGRVAPGRARRRAADRAQRLAVRGGQVGAAAGADHASASASAALPLIYVNQVGGQDELVFDGGSFVVNADGAAGAGAAVLEGVHRADGMGAHAGKGWRCDGHTTFVEEPRLSAVYHAMVLGPARLRAEEQLPGRPAGHVGRHRLGAHRGRGRGRPRARSACAACGCRRGSRPPPSLDDAAESARLLGMRCDTRGHRGARGRRRGGAGGRCSPAWTATSRRRTCRPACAGCC